MVAVAVLGASGVLVATAVSVTGTVGIAVATASKKGAEALAPLVFELTMTVTCGSSLWSRSAGSKKEALNRPSSSAASVKIVVVMGSPAWSETILSVTTSFGCQPALDRKTVVPGRALGGARANTGTLCGAAVGTGVASSAVMGIHPLSTRNRMGRSKPLARRLRWRGALGQRNGGNGCCIFIGIPFI